MRPLGKRGSASFLKRKDNIKTEKEKEKEKEKCASDCKSEHTIESRNLKNKGGE